MQRFIASAGFVVALAAAAPASASDVIVPLDISNQVETWVGEGANGSGAGQVSATLGACSPAGGGDSTCNMTGNFVFGGGGNYDFKVTGPSPFQGTETSPGSNFFNLNFSNTTYQFTLNFNSGLSATYVDINGSGAPPHQFSWTDSFVSPDATCTGVGFCSGSLVGATPGSTLSGPVTFTLTVASVPVPAPSVAVSRVTGPTGAAEQYSYQYNDLTGAGDVFIPIIDPSALVVSSLPSNVTIISDLATIEADWPGAGNFVPADEPVFDLPPELLEVAEDGAYSLDFSFLDKDLPVDGPILADGTPIADPPVPGSSAVPEPATWVMMLLLVTCLACDGQGARRGRLDRNHGGDMRMTVRKLIFRASLSGLALGVIPGMPASASDIVHNPHARSGQLSRIWTFFDCRSHSPIGNTGSYGARGTVTVKFVPQHNCGNAQEPTNEVWYVSPAGFKGLDTLTFPFGAKSKMVLNVTVD